MICGRSVFGVIVIELVLGWNGMIYVFLWFCVIIVIGFVVVDGVVRYCRYRRVNR